jgi:hypothetical protein
MPLTGLPRQDYTEREKEIWFAEFVNEPAGREKNMKRLFFLLCSAFLVTASIAAQVDAAAEITFVFTRQNGSGSNQFAVWIENSQGRHIQTLYATPFTAQGGWERREASLPQWVRQSGLARMSRSQVDAFSGATPQNGRQTLRWDGRNDRGADVPPGEYKMFIEGTLRNENRVLYSAVIPLGGSSRRANADIVRKFFGNGTAERGMIDQVSVRLLR